MIDEEMIDYEKLWCESCPNFDRERIGMDGYSTCKASGSQVYAEGYECECRFRDADPSDVVKVVRCKDCERFVPTDKDRKGGFCDLWSKHDCVVELGGNEYCSHGERREK